MREPPSLRLRRLLRDDHTTKPPSITSTDRRNSFQRMIHFEFHHAPPLAAGSAGGCRFSGTLFPSALASRQKTHGPTTLRYPSEPRSSWRTLSIHNGWAKGRKPAWSGRQSSSTWEGWLAGRFTLLYTHCRPITSE